MRIDRLDLENFKGFAAQSFDLHPQFTLFIGDNGTGKTTVLDALAVAAGIWLVTPPDSYLQSSGRNIGRSEIRLVGDRTGDRMQFRERKPVAVRASGQICDLASATWTRQIRPSGSRTSNADAREALAHIQTMYAADADGVRQLFPVLAYYGAGRAWLPSNQPLPKQKTTGPARRWNAFYDCFNERIRLTELQQWFSRETIERGNRGGEWRPGFQAVRQAILRCVPESDDIWFDTDRNQIVLSIAGRAQPFDNLSAGQRMMLALVADLAIKAVTQNAYLLDEGVEAVLRRTPGLVLIDEIDVHLHPHWQRRVASDLKAVFPSMQFVCTTHSPQVIGEVPPEQIRVLEEGAVHTPMQSFGLDSNRALEEVMDAPSRNADVQEMLAALFAAIDREDFPAAATAMGEVESVLGPDDPELVRARSLIHFLQPGQ